MSQKITRREFVSTTLVGAAVAAAAPALTQTQSTRPNILFILADDLGYGDLSCYGRPDYQTPNLDRLAAQGVRFVNAYSASPLCTPTRCAYITGRYPARTRVGLEEPLHEKRALGDKAMTLGLPPEHPTIASLLKQVGYQTALIGKWHLGYLPTFGPVQSGFEEFFGVMSGAVDFFTHKDMEGDLDLFEGKVPVERVGYLTEMLTSRAVEYLKKRAVTASGRGGTPFYLSLQYTAPHWPWEAAGDKPPDPELRGSVAFRRGGSLKTYASMMKSLDDGIGEVLKALADSGLDRNTVVIFTSDNGGERFSYNWPFMGQKNSLLEGGIRIPAIVRWPGMRSNVQSRRSKVGSSGGVVDYPIITMDWTATLLAAGGAKSDPNYPLDGIDLSTVIRDPNGATRNAFTTTPNPLSPTPSSRTFFWRNGKQDAANRFPWKYLNDGTREYLFNLSIDQHEQADFRDQRPEIFNELRTAFKAWESTVLPHPVRKAAS